LLTEIEVEFAVCFSGEKFAFFGFFLNMGEWCTAAHAGHTHAVYTMRAGFQRFWLSALAGICNGR
jgi:hypothetical protein